MARQAGSNNRAIFAMIFDQELDDLKDYVATIDTSLSKRFDEFGEEVTKTTEGMSEDDAADHVESVTDTAFQLADRFPAMARKTAFVFLYGLLEHSLLSVCNDVKKYGKFTEDPTGGSDKGITAAKVYLKEVAKLPFPDQSSEWNEIDRMAYIRNGFIHRMGRIKGDEPDKALKAYIKKKKGLIEIEGIGKTRLNAGYCEDAIKIIRKFFKSVLDIIPDEMLSFTEEEERAEMHKAMEVLRSRKK